MTEPYIIYRNHLKFPPPYKPRRGDELIIDAPLYQEHGMTSHEVRVLIDGGTDPEFRVREVRATAAPREWIFINKDQPYFSPKATLEQLMGYSEEEVEDIVSKLRKAPKWYRTTVSRICDFLSWIDHRI